MTTRKPRFLRSDTARHSRLGKNRKNMQKWRRPRGRHNKIRRKRFGYPKPVTIGYGTPRAKAGLIENKQPFLVHNLKELQAVPQTGIVIIARIGAKKKLELIKVANERKLPLANVSGGTQ